jgi:hypothetical protein
MTDRPEARSPCWGQSMGNRKRIADTSRLGLASIGSTLSARGADVLEALQRVRRHRGLDPTAYELLRFMQNEYPALDLNAVRPRLSELRDAGRVQTTGKRRCTITNRAAYTWAAALAPVPAAAYVDRPSSQVQGRLL